MGFQLRIEFWLIFGRFSARFWPILARFWQIFAFELKWKRSRAKPTQKTWLKATRLELITNNFQLIFLTFDQCESQQQKSTRGCSIAPLENERKNGLWCHFSYLSFYMYVSAHLCRPTLLSIKVHTFLEFKWISYMEYCTCLKYCNHLIFFFFCGLLDFSLKAHLAII